MNFPTPRRSKKPSETREKEIYSFWKDADDKDHHSIFMVMLYNGSRRRWAKKKQHYVELSRLKSSFPPS